MTRPVRFALLAPPHTPPPPPPPPPQESRTRVPGLASEAVVITDRWGIPHIRAGNLPDLYQAWGWTAARDRLWQMVYARAAGEGLTHRWLGNRALQADGGAQLFRLRERAREIWSRDQHDAHVREVLERYCAGVNAYLAECRRGTRAWPPEFRRLGERPRDWRPEDCVLMMLGFGVTLDLDLPEIDEASQVTEHGARWLEHRRRFEDRWIYDTIPDSAARRLWPGEAFGRVGGGAAGTGDERGAGASLAPELRARLDGVLAAFPPRAADGGDRASNAFAVGPRRSASGLPILANDPHLGLNTPGAFHVVHVSVPGALDAVGGSVAGLPIIATGRNSRVAWGVTALSADVVDVFADTLSPDGRRVRDFTKNSPKWAPVQTQPFDLRYRVLGVGIPLPPFVQARRYTPRGPVLVWEPKRHVAYSAQWTAMYDHLIELDRLFGIERARTSQEVVDAFATLITPCFNLVVADVDGDVRYRAVGLLPNRTPEFSPGMFPSGGRQEWRSMVPRPHMPEWRVPPDGFAVSANNRPAGGDYPYPLPRFDWPHDRARRMAQRLSGDRSITIADAMSVQNDVYSLAAERNLRQMLRCADSLRGSLPARSRAALDTLRAWDLRSRRSKVAPTLYRAWYGAFVRRSRLEGLPGLALAAFSGEAPEALVAPGTSGKLESPAQAAVAALTMALDTLEARLGPDLARWHYARAHQARFRHALSALDSRARWEPPLTPEDGDNATPSVGSSRLPWSLEVTHGPVFRHVVDLAQPSVSHAILTPWNSAAFAPTGERDLRTRWANHAYVPLHMDWARIDSVAMDHVRLGP